MVIGVYHQGELSRWQPSRGNEAVAGSGVGSPGRMANLKESLSKGLTTALGLLLYLAVPVRAFATQSVNGIMLKKEIFDRLRFIFGCAVIGGVTASMFFGWIDRSVDMQTIGIVIGAGAATLTEIVSSEHVA